MLAEKIDQTIQVLEDYSNLDDKVNKMKNAVRLLTKLAEYLERLNKTLLFVGEAQDTFKEFHPKFTCGGTVDKLLRDLKENLKNLGNLDHYSDNVGLEGGAIAFDSDVKVVWDSFIRRFTNDIYQSLQAIEPLYGNQDQLRDIKAEIGVLRQKWPLTRPELNKLHGSTVQGGQLIKNLNVDDKIRDFLVLISQGQATLKVLDEQVILWLKANHLEERLKIKFS